MLRTTLKSLWSRKRRLVGTGLAIVFGVAFLSATLVIGDSARSAFSTAFTEANQGIDTYVRSDREFTEADATVRAALDASLVDEISGLDIVDTAVGEIEGYAQVLDADGDPIGGGGPPTVGGNWIDDPRLTGWDLAEGRAPESPDEIVVDRATFEDADAEIGGQLTVLVPEPTRFRVVGVATFGDDDSLGPTTYTAFTDSRARELFMKGDSVSAVSVAGVTGSTPEDVTAAVDTIIPAQTIAMTGDELTAEMEADIESDFLGFMTMGLTVFAGIALLVAAFSIYNTFSIIVAQRTRESALMRAIGASRRQVLVATLIESTIMGAVASLVGFGVGAGLGTALMGVMAAAGFGFGGGTVVSVAAAVTSVVVGLVITVIGGLAPAWRASAVSPMAALRDVAVDDSDTSRVRLGLGGIATAAGSALVIFAGESIALAGVGAVVVLVGVLLLGPVVARPIAGLLGRPLRLRGVAGDLARRNAIRNPKRTAATASALLIGVGIVSLFTVFGSSLQSSIEDEVSQAFAGDLMVGSTGFGGPSVTASMVDDIADLGSVDAVAGLGFGPALVDGEEELVDFTSDAAAESQVLNLDVSSGSLHDLDADSIAVSRAFADDNGYAVGDQIEIGFIDGGGKTTELVAIYDADEFAGPVTVDGALWEAGNVQSSYQLAMVSAAAGTDVETARADIRDIVNRGGGLDVQDRDEFIESAAGEIDVLLTVVYALLAIAIIIALMGIANTMSLSIHERIRELGLLRAVGLTRSQLRSTVRWESVLVSTFGAVGGLGLGMFLSWGLVSALTESEGFGTFDVPGTSLIVILVLGAGAGLVAGLRPARRAAKIDVLDAIATD